MQPLMPSEMLIYTTVRVEATDAAGAVRVGTGFFLSKWLTAEKAVPFLITNKHLVGGAVTGKIRVHLQDASNPDSPSGKSQDVDIDRFEDQFYPHPNGRIDLCLMPVQPLFTAAEQRGVKIFHKEFNDMTLPTDEALNELGAVETVLMVGYPNGLWDEVNNLPIVRRGITATHPAIGYNGQSEMLVDIACFPGSSGSPVVLYDNGMYVTRRGRVDGGRLLLLGVLHAGYQIHNDGQIEIRDIPTTQVPVAVTPTMMHLGCVVKSHEISTMISNYIKSFRQSA